MDEKIYLSMYVYKKVVHSFRNHVMKKIIEGFLYMFSWPCKNAHTETPHFPAKIQKPKNAFALFWYCRDCCALPDACSGSHCREGLSWKSIWDDWGQKCLDVKFANWLRQCMLLTPSFLPTSSTAAWFEQAVELWPVPPFDCMTTWVLPLPEVTTPDGCDVTSDIGFACFSYKTLSSLESKMSIL